MKSKNNHVWDEFYPMRSRNWNWKCEQLDREHLGCMYQILMDVKSQNNVVGIHCKYRTSSGKNVPFQNKD